MARVLVADDDVAIRTLVQRVLVRDGFAVDLAADGREALAKIALGNTTRSSSI